MFYKKCPKCSSKIKKDYDYCPSCGVDLKSKNHQEDYGFLGKNDSVEDANEFEGFESFLDKVFNTTMKMLEKQVKNLDKQDMPRDAGRLPGNLRVQFFVNGKKAFPEKPAQVPNKKVERKKISPEKMQKFAKFPKEEANSKMKRLGGKVVYELDVPGVRNLDDVFINYLESSIEVKALADDKVYSKTLNIKSPMIGYGLNQDSLIIEFRG